MRIKKNSGSWYFWLGFAIPVLFVLIGFIVIGVWPFGNGTVLIIDSLHQYLPFYTDFHEKLVNHDSLLYSFSAGLGYNFWATYAYYLASPFNFLMYFIPTANVCDFMDLSILLKIGLCGGCFSWYLHKRRTDSLAFPLAFGTMYALSFFLIGYYFNLMWLDSIAMLPLIMKGIEKICGIEDDGVRGDSSCGLLYCLTLFYALWCNYYIGFMLCIFAVLYFCACMITAGSMKLKTFLARSGRFAWYSLLAGGMGAMVLYPAYRALTASEAMQENTFPSVIKFYDSFIDLVMAHFAAIPPINVASSQVGLNAYCGTAVFLFLILYILDRKINLREKIVHLALMALLFFSFSQNILNYIWHGFHQQNGIPNRFAFIYVLLILTMSFDASAHIETMALWKIIVSGAVPIAFAVTAFVLKLGQNYEDEPFSNYTYLITLALFCAYFILLLFLHFRRAGRMACSFLVSTFLVIEAGASAVYGIWCNDSVTRDIYLNDQAAYKELMAEIGDDSWYRSEVDVQRMRNITLFCGGKALVMFNSTMQASVTNFCDRIGMEARTNKNGYNGVTGFMNDILGVRYVLSANGKGSSLYGMNSVNTNGSMTVYKNEDALNAGFLVSPDILNWNIEEGTPIDVQNAFVRLAAGMDDIFVLDRYIDLEDGADNGIKIPQNKEVYVYLPSRVSEMKLTTPEYNKTYSTYTDHLYTICSCDGVDEASFSVTLGSNKNVRASVYTCPDAAEKAVIEKLAAHQMTNVQEKGRFLTGDITADEDSVLLITIPYDRNWTCTVDGEKVEALCIGSALMGLAVGPGVHSVKLSYMPDGMKEGCWISFFCVLLFLLSCFISFRKRKGGSPDTGEDQKGFWTLFTGKNG